MPLFKFAKKSKHSSEPSSSHSSPSPRVIAWNGLLSMLPIVRQSLDAVPVPGVKVAVGGLLEILKGLDVREKSTLLYQAPTQPFGAYKKICSNVETATELCKH